MRVIEMMEIILKPASHIEDADVELKIRIRVGGVEHSYIRVLNIDHFKSRFDYIFVIAKEYLRRLVLKDDEEGE